MTCDELIDSLDELAAGTLDDARARRLATHLAGCAACRELVELVRGEPALPVRPPEGFVSGVLSATARSSCGRCHELLADLVDGRLGAVDRELVELHLGSCGECRRLARVVAVLGDLLPELAELPPDPRFVADVLRATLPWRRRAARWWGRIGPLLLARPRIAWEGAYVGALVLMLIFGFPGSPLADVPGQALAVARVNPVTSLEGSLAGVAKGAGAGAETLWQGHLAPLVASYRDRLLAVGQEAAGTAGAWYGQARTFWRGLASQSARSEEPSSRDAASPQQESDHEHQ